jgi:hypothetical protein
MKTHIQLVAAGQFYLIIYSLAKETVDYEMEELADGGFIFVSSIIQLLRDKDNELDDSGCV